MKIYDVDYLEELTVLSKSNQRMRQHRNLHQSYDDPCQCLFNAIEPYSYIQPHRHGSNPSDERLFAVRGLMALLIFNEIGRVVDIVKFGTEKYGDDIAVGVSISSHIWHTVVALENGSILCEVKAGPFDPNQPKDLATWAPSEGSAGATDYLNSLYEEILSFFPAQ